MPYATATTHWHLKKDIGVTVMLPIPSLYDPFIMLDWVERRTMKLYGVLDGVSWAMRAINAKLEAKGIQE